MIEVVKQMRENDMSVKIPGTRKIVKIEEEPKKIYTYDELLTPYFQVFGYFANKMEKSLDEVKKYFRDKYAGKDDIQIMGEYVRLNVDNFTEKKRETFHPVIKK